MKPIALLFVLALSTSLTLASDPQPKPQPPAPATAPAHSLITAASATPAKQPAQAIAPAPPRSGWSLGAGAQWRQFGDLRFRSTSQASSFQLPRIDLGSGGHSDGYVLPDVTGSSSSTWNFGYNSLDPGSNSLTLHGSQTSSQLIAQTYNSDWADSPSNTGIFLQLQSPELLRYHSLSAALSLGYSWTRADIGHSAHAFHAAQYLTTSATADSYNIAGLGLPPAPYQGTFNGPGPTIPLQPSSHRITGSDSALVASYDSSIRSQLRIDLHTLSLGPDIEWQHRSLHLTLSTGLALNLAHWSATTTETLRNNHGSTLATWSQHHSSTDILPGYYLQTQASYPLSARWSVLAQARYDWSQQLSGSVGSSDFALSLTGWTLGLGASYRF